MIAFSSSKPRLAYQQPPLIVLLSMLSLSRVNCRYLWPKAQ